MTLLLGTRNGKVLPERDGIHGRSFPREPTVDEGSGWSSWYGQCFDFSVHSHDTAGWVTEGHLAHKQPISVICRGCLPEMAKEEDQVGHVTQIWRENGGYNKVSVRERVRHVACRRSNWMEHSRKCPCRTLWHDFAWLIKNRRTEIALEFVCKLYVPTLDSFRLTVLWEPRELICRNKQKFALIKITHIKFQWIPNANSCSSLSSSTKKAEVLSVN